MRSSEEILTVRFLTATAKSEVWKLPDSVSEHSVSLEDNLMKLSLPELLPGRSLAFGFPQAEIRKCNALL